jgi:hypothetical protein
VASKKYQQKMSGNADSRSVLRKAAEAGLVDWGKAEAAAGVDNSRSGGVVFP